MGERMASRLTMLSFLGIAFAFYFLAVSPFTAQGYTMTYYMQDNGTTSPITAYPPSFFSPNSCTMQITGYSTSTDTDGLFFLNNQYYSGSSVLGETGYNPYTGNIACKSFSSVNSTETRLGFYEASMKSIFTASPSLDSWLKVKYYCAESGDTFIYNNSGSTDLFGFHPFSYGGATYSFCNCIYGSGCSTCSSRGSNLTRFMEVYKEILRTTEYPCGTIMSRDKAGDASYGIGSGGLSFDMSYEKYISIPFRTGATGRVNFSVFGFRYTGSASITPLYHVYNPANNQTHTLGSAFPLYAAETLESNTDYFFIIGMHVAYAGSSPMVLTYIGVNFSISVSTYVPNWSCEYSECVNSIRLYSCIDANGRLTTRFGEEACPTGETETLFNKMLGFEDGYEENAYVCSLHNPGLYLPCAADLGTYKTRIPTNWTNTASKDIIGVIMENTASLTNIYSAVSGVNALMLRYIPPKQYEPIVNPTSYPYPPTVCGNKSVGSNGEITAPYNNESYVGISQNVTLSDSPEISLYAKKCPYSEVQYDTLADAFIFGLNASCGKMYYDGSADGSKTINGDYRLSVKGWQNVTQYVASAYTAVAPVVDITFNTSVIDGNVSDVILFDHIETPYGIIINTSGNSFTNGTKITFFINKTVTPGVIQVHIGADIYTEILGVASITGSGLFEITLTISAPTNTVYILSGAGMEILIDYISITNPENFTTEYINFPFGAVATDEWVKTTVPLSHLGLQDNGLYTIFLGVTSKTGSSVYPNPSCVLFDDFQIQNADRVLTEETCTSGCNENKEYIKGVWTGTYCLRYEYPAYSDNCITNGDKTIVDVIESCNTSQKSYCTEDGVYRIYDCTLKLWEDRVNTTLCSTEVVNREESNQTDSVLGDLFDLGAFSFFLSPFMIVMYVAMILAGVITFYTESWEIGALVVTMVLIGGTFGGIIPAWILFTIIIAIVALVAFKISQVGGG